MVRAEILVRQGDALIVDDATETRYQLASVSKQFTAAAVLLLVEDGMLSLGDPVGRWIDDCPNEWQGITLHHLLTHTSGLGQWRDYPMINLAEWVKPRELREIFHHVPLRYPPGEGWSYSSPAYVLLAQAVERAAGTPYRIFLADRIFDPLGLDKTFAGAPSGQPDLARGHDAAGEPLPTWELDVVGMGAGSSPSSSTIQQAPLVVAFLAYVASPSTRSAACGRNSQATSLTRVALGHPPPRATSKTAAFEMATAPTGG
jgi:CubicO group peptidase (beta-lactamase class C family)